MTIAVVFNPIAGAGRAAGDGRRVAESLKDAGHSVVIVETRMEPPSQWLDPELKDCRVIVVAGGDGTVRQVSDIDAAVIFQGILAAGDRYEVPERFTAPVLRAGNAGAVYLLIDGAPYGPLGSSGGVVKNLSLRAADIERRVPQAAAGAIGVEPGGDTQQRAEAVLPQ